MLSLSSLPSTVVPSLPSSPGGCATGGPRVWSSSQEVALFQTLQEALREIDLPETQDLPQGMSHSELCVCVLGSPLPYLSLLLEVGQRSPGDALLCLSPSWLSHSSPSLLVHKAVTFDLGGRTFLSNFNPPRRVTYFLSCDPWAEEEVTRETDCPSGGSGALGRFWGDVLTTRVLLQKAKIHCPPTLALLLPPGQMGLEEGRTGGVEVVHLEMGAEGGMNSVRNKVDSFLESEDMKGSESVVLRCSGGRFVGEATSPPVYLSRNNRDEVWAKVGYLLPQLLPGEAVLLEVYCSPLKPGPRVEDRTWERYTDCRPQVPDLSFRLCAIVSRSPLDLPLLYKLVCRVGVSDAPLSHSHSLSQSLEITLLECGFTDPTMATSLRRLATDTALSCLCVVMETESSMSAELRGGAGAQTDMIGVDLLFTMDGYIISPVVLGLHPSLCLRSSFSDRGMGMEMEGCDSGIEGWSRGTLLLTPLTRSQYYLMQGKTVLVVGAGGHSKKFIWGAAKKYKLKILLVDCDPAHFASQLVDHFLPLPDLPDHRRDDQHCSRICDWLLSSGLRPDGCVCFWDDCVVLTSLVCDRLGLRGPPPEAIRIAKEKSRTHRHLQGLLKSTGTNLISVEQPSGQADGLVEFREGERRGRQQNGVVNGMVNMEGDSMRAMADFDRGDLFNEAMGKPDTTTSTSSSASASSSFSQSFGTFRPSAPLLSPSPSSYAVPCIHVESALDLEKAASGGVGGLGGASVGVVRFPAIMKLEYGAGAVGVRKVGSLEESLAHFERIGGDLREETDYPGIGLGWGNAMTLMEYVGGTEHDVDVVLFEGRLEGAFVSDNGPTRAPAFTETASQMPSGLAPEKRAQLIRAAHHACLGCGLQDGVFNVEMKMTEVGPRLIEINARMGGFYLRDWIRQLYGVDILMAAFMVSCGLRPCLPSATALPARGHFAGVMVVVSQHLQALRSTASPERLRGLHQEGALWLNELAEEDELISGEYEEPFCNVGVRDAHNAANARQRLLALCQGLGLHCPPRYDLGYFLSHFN
ncbi:carnosine synthase 1-like isoform X1 [Coregonus clupeaformis]|uniref:carnosine synthase 1-like isoform X1 n=2 Tax=Coregonus clupeaformis TaxID=59861 RepID=UPI001E1C68F5|nr:carnosine synthase 1-like isoform X1 [Coregonus clupeaformis]